jgi:hypothetical protein
MNGGLERLLDELMDEGHVLPSIEVLLYILHDRLQDLPRDDAKLRRRMDYIWFALRRGNNYCSKKDSDRSYSNVIFYAPVAYNSGNTITAVTKETS